jgi:hypothetical protein
MRTTTILFLLVSLAASCASPRVIHPAADQEAKVETLRHDGKPYLRSVLHKTEVSAQLTSLGGRKLALDLFFYNEAYRQFLVNPMEVQVTGFNAWGIPQAFRLFSAEEYIRRRNTRNAVAGGIGLAVAVASAVVLLDAAPAGGGALGSELLWLGASTLPPIVGSFAPEPVFAEDGLARPHNLFPETAYRGAIMIQGDKRYFHRIQVSVPAGSIWHRFDFLPLIKE